MSTDTIDTAAGRGASVLRSHHLRVMCWLQALAVCLAMSAGVAAEQQQPVDVHSGPGWTLLGHNGTCPESHDGKRVVYMRIDDVKKSKKGELWVAGADLQGHRKVCEFPRPGVPHNGGMASWVDHRRVAFRSQEPGKGEAVNVIDVDAAPDPESGAIPLIHGPIYGVIGHYAVKGKLPFAVYGESIVHNREDFPTIDEEGLYILDCDSGEIEKVLGKAHLVAYAEEHHAGLLPKGFTLRHAMLNPSGTRIMARWGRKIVVSCNLQGEAITIFHPKPLHQLWYDDETYVAVGGGGICRFTQDGKKLELLGGRGNHIDLSPDKQWTVTDNGYGGTPVVIKLYARGHTEPSAILATHPFANEIWKRRAHSNPVFSRDGRHVYFNHVFEQGVVRLVRVPVPGG